MDALWFYAILFVTVWVAALLFRKQLKIDIHGLLLMRRTKRMRCFIDGLAQKKFHVKRRQYNWDILGRSISFEIGPTISPWRVLLNVGVPVSFFFMFLMFVSLIYFLNTVFTTPQAGLVIPGLDLPGSPFVIPLGSGIIALAILMIVHEFGHGILARVEGVRIKSIGVLMLAVIPGAFVEPNEDDIKKAKRGSRLRIYAAGSVFNLMVALLALLVFMGANNYVIPNTFHSDGIYLKSVVPASPAEGILKPGMVIESINGHPTNNISDYIKATTGIKIGDVVTFKTDQGTYKIKTTKNPSNSSRPYIGYRPDANLVINSDVAHTYGNQLPWVWFYIVDLFFWIWFLNFAVATFNLLPAKPLDGGLMFEDLLSYKFSEDHVKSISSAITWVVWFVVALYIIFGPLKGILIVIQKSIGL